MYILICELLQTAAPLFVALSYFSRFSGKRFRWYLSLAGSLAIWLGMDLIQSFQPLPVPAFFLFAAELLLLFSYGFLVLRCDWLHSLTVSILILSVLYLSNGITSTAGHWIAKTFGTGQPSILLALDLAMALLSLLLLTLFLQAIFQVLYQGRRELNRKALLLLSFPILFIALAEQTVANVIYGDTVIWDSAKGFVYPAVNDLQILLLQLFACLGLASILAAYHRLERAMETERTNQLLAQQAREQSVYLEEAQLRLQQTRAFRHDVNNHLLLVHELLKAGRTAKALEYLAALKDFPKASLCPCQTGNPAADALLGSKLSVAQQKGIETRCTIKIPQCSSITDLDWCIVLSNGVDNAIQACEDSEAQGAKNTFLHLSGSRQGNFYLLTIENSCPLDRTSISEGTGVANIRAVVQKHGGTLTMELSEGVCKLDVLFLISQQQGAIPHQTH